MMMEKFISYFMIGAATAAHQVEGNNVNSDFWTMEHMVGTMYKDFKLPRWNRNNQLDDKFSAWTWCIKILRIGNKLTSYSSNLSSIAKVSNVLVW
ncbi:hypothetical protein [Robertmurraya sp. P23]|uniref:hypothetical protein n=1 Tax=Robertmurraya sp. P23 TaxID=3436931 RepID=UPI003D95E3CF